MASATPPAKAEKCPCDKHHDPVSHDSDHDRRHAVQYIGGEADYVSQLVAPIFRQINSSADSDRHTDSAGDQQNESRTGDGIGHPTAGFAHRLWSLREEGPIDGANALVNQVSEDRAEREQNQDHSSRGRESREGIHAAPPQADRGSSKVGGGSHSFRHGFSPGCRV